MTKKKRRCGFVVAASAEEAEATKGVCFCGRQHAREYAASLCQKKRSGSGIARVSAWDPLRPDDWEFDLWRAPPADETADWDPSNRKLLEESRLLLRRTLFGMTNRLARGRPFSDELIGSIAQNLSTFAEAQRVARLHAVSPLPPHYANMVSDAIAFEDYLVKRFPEHWERENVQ